MTAAQIQYITPYLISVFVSLGIAIYVWQFLDFPGAASYGFTALGGALTTATFILEVLAPTLPGKLFWDNVQWFTWTMIGVSFLSFSIDFAGLIVERWRTLVIGLAIPPAVLFFLMLTNPVHGWVVNDAVLLMDMAVPVLSYPFTLTTTVYSVYLLLIGFAGIAILMHCYTTLGPPYRTHVLIVLIGITVPLVGGILTLSGIGLTPQRDLTPIGLIIGNVMVLWGLVQYGLFRLSPIARTTVFEHIGDAVVVIDTRNIIVDINPAGRELAKASGWAAGTIGKPLMDVFSNWRMVIEQYADTHNLTYVEAEVSVGGGLRTYIVKLAPVELRGSRVGRVLVVQDITERKQMEEDLRRANQIKSQFLATMSHEIRTPLNAVLNFNQFVSSGLYGQVNERQQDALEKSTGSARHLLALINDVLDLSKIEADRMELFLERDVDLLADLRDIVETAASLVSNKPVELIVNLPATLPRVEVDRRRIRQVVLNLLSNAAKFTEEGHITFAVAHRPPHICISVADTGPGIPEEDHATIFEPFQQLERERRTGTGTGLGLPISRRLVEAHQGVVWFESQVGQGTTFYVQLPIHQQEQKA